MPDLKVYEVVEAGGALQMIDTTIVEQGWGGPGSNKYFQATAGIAAYHGKYTANNHHSWVVLPHPNLPGPGNVSRPLVWPRRCWSTVSCCPRAIT